MRGYGGPFGRSWRASTALVASLLLGSAAQAATFTVTSTADSGTGSLRDAINAANATPGLDQVVFAIPGVGPHTIAPTSELTTISEAVVVDGYTQPGAQPNTLAAGSDAVLQIELSGASAGAGARGLVFNGFARGSTVRGLVINGFSGDGVQFGPNIADMTLTGSFIGTDVTGTVARPNLRGVYISSCNDCTIGGTISALRNVISGNDGAGVRAEFGGRHRVAGNYIGVAATGLSGLGNNNGIEFQSGFDNDVGGTTPAARNVISGNRNDGIRLLEAISIPGRVALIRGNFIGTNAAGDAGLGNFSHGVYVDQDHVFVGGTDAGAGNVIAGSAIGIRVLRNAVTIQGNRIGTNAAGTAALGNGNGVLLVTAACTDALVGGGIPAAGNVLSGNITGVVVGSAGVRNQIAGNLIGVAADGVTPLPNTWGMRLINAGPLVVGGLPAFANTIAHNLAEGIQLTNNGRDVAMRYNAIFANGALGIDHGANGVTPNDALDADMATTGPQNFPVLTGATFEAGLGVTTVTGTLATLPNAFVTVDLYASDGCDPSGFGEGQRWVGATGLTTDAAGLVSFTTIADEDLTGSFVTALATNGGVSTSEFSSCIPVNRPPVAVAGPDQTLECEAGEADALLDGSGSSDPDGDPLEYLWLEGATTLATGVAASVTLAQGVHDITLRVSDPAGASGTDGLRVTVADTQAPTIACPAPVSAAQTTPTGTTVTYSVTASDLCEGPKTPSCSPASGSLFLLGSTTVSCSVSDGSGNVSSCSFPVVVSPPASTPNHRVTADGYIPLGQGRAVFAVEVTSGPTGALNGHVLFRDLTTRRTVVSTKLTALVVSGTHAQLFGFAKVSGHGRVGFVIDLDDLGQPGRNVDFFGIALSDGYAASGNLGGGEVKIRRLPPPDQRRKKE